MKLNFEFLNKHRVCRGDIREGVGEYDLCASGVFKWAAGGYYTVVSVGDDLSILHGWEHVSVSKTIDKDGKMGKTPTWKNMCDIKKLFWGDDETVLQFYPRDAEYTHPAVLHLWKQVGIDHELPQHCHFF